MSREAALDLRQIIRACDDAVVAIGLQRSRPFRWPVSCAFPVPHNTPVHLQSELGLRVPAMAVIVTGATIAGLWAALPAVSNAAEHPASI